MQNKSRATPRSVLVAFSIALSASVTGILLGPHVVAQFSGAPVWMLPAVICSGMLLALFAVAVAFKRSTGGRNNGRNNPGREA